MYDISSLDEYKDKCRNFLYDKKQYIMTGLSVAKSITAFATNHSWLSFVEGGFNLLHSVAQLGNTSQSEFFAEKRGWKIVITSSWKDQAMFDILSSALVDYPHEIVQYGSQSLTTNGFQDRIFAVPFGYIGLCKDCMYVKSKTTSVTEVRDFLLEEKIKSIGSKCYYLAVKNTKQDKYSQQTNFDLCVDESIAIDSAKGSELTAYLKSYLDQNINRSVIFLGPPGTGKSTLIHTIIKNLNLTSFRFKYDHFKIDSDSIKNLLCSLKVDVIIMDDFDQGLNNAFLLEFLEWANRHLKLILASTNSLKTVHPAIIRPGRFAELIEISSIDDTLLRSLLGARYEALAPQVNTWPVAYINELITRLNIHGNTNQDVLIEELDDRVNKALALLKG